MAKPRYPNRIAHWRELRLLSQEQVAGLVGCHPKSVARYEQGRAMPEVSVAIKLAQALGVQVEALWSDLSETWREQVLRRIREHGWLPGYPKKHTR